METFLDININLNRNGFNLNVNEQIPYGIIGIYGQSGHGKSSLLNSISGIITPSGGKISINGKAVFDKQNNINIPVKDRQIGYLFQDDRLFPHLSVLKNLRYGQKPNGRIKQEEVIEILKIEKFLTKRPNECSGGECQRIALGRALLSSPQLLLLDEPFSAVDVKLRGGIIPYLVNINRKFGIPMLVVSHDLPDLLSLTNYLLLLYKGTVTATGLFGDLITNEKNVSLMQGAGLYNSFDMTVFAFHDSKDMVLLKSLKYNLMIQAVTSSFQSKIVQDAKVKVLVRPEDITLTLFPVEGITLRNQIEGVIEKFFFRNGYSFCLINAGERILVEITEASRKNMKLEPGQKVHCLFKSMAIKIY